MSVPAFNLTSSGVDFSTLYAQRLISLRVTDDASEHSDSFECELSNKDGLILIPYTGQVLTLQLGYRGNLSKVGDFTVDTVELSGPPDTVKFHGKAAPFTSVKSLKPFQSRRSRSFSNISIGDLVSKISQETGLTPAVDPELSSIQLAQVDQTAESNMNLLTRIARYYGGVMKPKDGRLCFVQRGNGRTATGADMYHLTISRNQVVNYSASIQQRTNFDKVRTTHHNVTTGTGFRSETTVEGTTCSALYSYSGGDDEDDHSDDATYEDPHNYPDEESAVAASKAIYDKTTKGSISVSLTLPGDSTMVAGAMMTLVGFNDAMNKQWWIEKVEHSFSKNGFTTTLKGILPSGKKGDSEAQSGGPGGSFLPDTATKL